MRTLIILTIIFISTGISCKGPEIITVPLHDSSTIETSEKITEDPTWTEPESLLYQFAVECDENYRAILKQFNEINTGIEAEIVIKDSIIYREDGTKINRLLIDMSIYVDSIEVQNRTIEKLRYELSHQDIPVPVEVPVKYTSKLAKICMVFSLVAVLLIIFVIVYKIKVGSLKSLVSKLR